MFSTRTILLAAGLLAASHLHAHALLAQDAPAAHREGAGQRGMQHDPMQMLLDHRADLGLSDDQVTRLRAINADVMRQMEPLHQQMQQMHAAMGQQGGGDAQAAHQQMHPLMEQLHKIHDEAMQRVSQVLTPEQMQKVHQLMPHHEGQQGHDGGQGAASR
jgi:Spy/CpxP family protein refolding chaperone